MAGYTRQSIADIINGSDVTAPPLNAEFNQLASAFNGATGHLHDGSSGNAPKINLTTSVAGYLPAVHGGTGGKNNVTATVNPTITDDAGDGYAPGSIWENTTTGRVFICVGNTNNAAVWRELVQVQTGNKIIPEDTDTVDLGEPATRFQDLWLSGGLSAFGNGSLGGTLNVTGATALGSTLAVTGNTTVGGTLDVTGDTTVDNLTATGTTTITSGDINSGAMDGTTIGASTPAAGTFTNLTANTSLTAATADINGGTVDNATIGATTPSTGAFTTISTSGQATLASADINGGSIDGTTIGATSHTSGKFSTLQSTGNATLATADINGGTIDGTAIGGTVRSSGAFTTVSANNGITGDLTGDVTGNVTGNVTGAITGNVTGNLTGNVTSSGTSTFNNVTIDGTLNMNAGTTATITNLTTPTNANDAATKGYVDTSVADLVDAAPGTLDTLNELAAALNDDPNFSTTITNSIATKLPLAGGSMTGTISMGTNRITSMGDPTAAQDAATKAYVDQQDGLQVTKTGDSMSGNLAMGSNNITGLATPTANDHATNKSYVDGILGSATAASASAAAAATSESNAATSETYAANSAASAAADLSSVQSLYDQFDDRYLGSKASAPTVDNDGNALLSGALYFNNTTNLMYVYGGSGWVPAGSSVNGTSDRITYTASAGQTVFAATYDAGYVDVYLNGVKLVDGSDFTATNGTSVVLTTGAAVNDIVDIVAYGTFTLADHYTKTQTDARYVEVAGDTMTGNLNVLGSTGFNSTDAFNQFNFAANGTGTYTNLRITNSSSTAALSVGVGGSAVGAGSLRNNAYVWNTAASSLSFGTSDTERMVITSSGSVGIGTSSTIGKLDVSDGSNPLSIDSSTYNEIQSYNRPLLLNRQGNNVGIGTSSPDEKLEVYQGNIKLGTATNTTSKLIFERSAANRAEIYVGSSNQLQFDIGGSEAARLDASGNLLVGKTNADTGSTAGFEYNATVDVLYATRAGTTAVFNRLTSDGDIALFRQGGSTIGSIGVKTPLGNDGELIVGSTDCALRFRTPAGGTAFLSPAKTDATSLDAAMDLGDDNERFRDAYLSGGVFLGGVGASNKLDDYEEGTWTPDLRFGGSNTGVTYANVEGVYTKIGRLVTLHFRMGLTDNGTAVGSAQIFGLPFAVGGVLATTSVQGGSPITFISGFVNDSDCYGVYANPWEGHSYLALMKARSNADSNNEVTNSNVSNTFDFRATVQYLTA